MDFINIVKQKATEIAMGAAKASTSAVTQVKSNLHIADKKQERAKALEALGLVVYEAYKNGAEPDADKIAEKCVGIDKIGKEIETLKKTIQEVKNVRVCPSCNAEIKNAHKFCPNCGEKAE